MKKDASLLVVLAAIALVSVLTTPPEPVEPLPQELPPVVETVEDVETHMGHTVAGNKLEAVAGLAVIGGLSVVAFKLSRLTEKHKCVIKTDNAAFVALMRKLETMSLILENVTDE